MRIDELIFEVRDNTRTRIGQLLPTDLVGWKSALRFNNVGTWELTLPANHALGNELAKPGAGIIVTHKTAGVIFSGITTTVETIHEAGDPNGVMILQGVDDSIILAERLAYPTPATADVAAQTSAYDVVTATKASTAMYGYVKRNLVSGTAPAARAITGFTTATDTAFGSLVTKSARFDILGELLTDIAIIDGLGFDVKQVGTNLVFEVFQPMNRTAEIRMDVTNNTLAKSSYGYGIMEATHAIVAGQGVGNARTFVDVTTTASTAAETLWKRRREVYIDQRNTAATAELTQAGLEKLADGGITVTSIDIIPSSDQTMRYGVDWGLGDKVTVVIAGQEVAATVTQVGITIEADGVRVGATIGQPVGVDYDSLIARRQRDTVKRVGQLERT